MMLLRLVVLTVAWQFTRSHTSQTPVRPPSFRRRPTLIDCRDGTSRPLVNASATDVSVLRSIHPHCPSSVLEFRETLPHCPDLSFCPREFRAISPCGDCCFVCREPNEDYMAENAAKGNSSQADKIAYSDPCHNIKCKRYQKCVLNIQGLPVCRCFPVQMCTAQGSSGLPSAIGGKKKKDKRLEKVCGNDGVSYETKCHMQVAACQANLHIRIAHKGACMKPAETSHRSEPSIKIKPSRGNRKQSRQNHNNQQPQQRFHPSTPTPSVYSAKTIGRAISHQPPAIVVPIISPPASRGGGRKQQGVGWSRSSSAGSAAASAPASDRDQHQRVGGGGGGGGGGKGRKAGRREKTSRPDRPRNNERQRPGRTKNERTDRGKSDRTERPWNERTDKTRQERTRVEKKPPRFKVQRTERLDRVRVGRPEKPKATKKIQRLERKKHKLEQRLIKEKEKARRKLS